MLLAYMEDGNIDLFNEQLELTSVTYWKDYSGVWGIIHKIIKKTKTLVLLSVTYEPSTFRLNKPDIHFN